jgi:two-component system response regulator GlrR
MHHILVVDDDKKILQVIRLRLESARFRVTTTEDADSAMMLVQEHDFDLALVDLKLAGGSGIDLMQRIKSAHEKMPVIILTAYGTIHNAVEAIQKGAYHYLTKPFDGRELLLQVEKCLRDQALSKEIDRLRKLVKSTYTFKNIIGRSRRMKMVLEQVTHAAETDSNICIEGRSGTGKELIAKTLHLSSSRRDGPFVAVNCSAIPETLLENELFGHAKGAFTGADQDHQGLLEAADAGTFFLDEISEIPLSMQVKLLRVLEEREFFPLGSQKLKKIDIRVIAASSKNLLQEVTQGRFREDLFYRIHVIPILMPSLSERKEDVPLLALHFLEKYSTEMSKSIREISPAAMQKLMAYHWPGNVRELENTIECAVALAETPVITEQQILKGGSQTEKPFEPWKNAKEEFEKQYLVQLLETTAGNMSQAAKLSGKYRADLYALLRKYDIDPSTYRNPTLSV